VWWRIWQVSCFSEIVTMSKSLPAAALPHTVHHASTAPQSPPAVEPGPWLRDVLIVAVFNSAIAALFAAIMLKGYWTSFVYSQCVGLSIFAFIRISMVRRGLSKPDLRTVAAGLPLGAVFGTVLGGLLAPAHHGQTPWGLDTLPGTLAGAVVFGLAISYFFYARTTIDETRAAVRQKALESAETQRLLAEAELAALQAQIEPHFLFNTLSNVAGLIETDPVRAKQMLTSFTSYLRGTLDSSRRGGGTLGQELELLRRYLDIMGIRMGGRLRWRIDVAQGIEDTPLPPLTLQPLVENAIEHGLGPLPEGGSVTVSARREGGGVFIDVVDDGVGFGVAGVPGIGLANVRARLTARHGTGAALVVMPSAPRGVRVTLRIPAVACQ
jgi:hypothetical protein